MAKARYYEPNDPFLKFKSDLARELTAKHFPFWNYHKNEKKVFRTPRAVLNDGRMFYNHYPVFYSFGSDALAIELGRGGGLVCYIESEGKGEEFFQNTNSVIPSEGYTSDTNFYYQGPTWVVRGGEDGKAKDFIREGLMRNQVADAIIECMKASCPERDFDNEWDEMVVEIDEKIKDKQSYVDEMTAKLNADPSEIDTGDGAWKDSWFRDRIQKNVNSCEKSIKELNGILEPPALPPELANTTPTTVDRKSRTYFGGDWVSTYDGRTCHWITAAWTKAEAVRNVKHCYYCSRRASTGCAKEPDYLAASVKCTQQFNSKEEAMEWKERVIALYI